MVSAKAVCVATLVVWCAASLQVHGGKIKFPGEVEVREETREVEEEAGERRQVEEGLEGDAAGRGLWESDLFFLQKLSGLFGGDEKDVRRKGGGIAGGGGGGGGGGLGGRPPRPYRRKIPPPSSQLRPELLPPQIQTNRRNGGGKRPVFLPPRHPASSSPLLLLHHLPRPPPSYPPTGRRPQTPSPLTTASRRWPVFPLQANQDFQEGSPPEPHLKPSKPLQPLPPRQIAAQPPGRPQQHPKTSRPKKPSLWGSPASFTTSQLQQDPQKRHPQQGQPPHHNRPRPQPQRVFIPPQKIIHKKEITSGNIGGPPHVNIPFNPSPQEGKSDSDAFQPVFVASPFLDDLGEDVMKPMVAEGGA
ncbi:basic salivary proline-rich protein 4-like [Scylla paramamosain]|uniref:basic salivary proline-rich protein 4-like n=1 Tax=Scylla paramamosain TaxID=85552 RepID=UPI003082878C